MKSVLEVVHEYMERTGDDVQLRLMDVRDTKFGFAVLAEVYVQADGTRKILLTADQKLTGEYAGLIIEKELKAIERGPQEPTSADDLANLIERLMIEPKAPELALCTFVIPEREVPEGILVKSAALAWQAMIEDFLRDKWDEVYKIDPRLFEEIIAGAFERSRLYDQVILTPRSGDKGRDIIAIKNGFSGFRVIGSVKRYAPGRLIKRAEVDELVGTLYRDPNASKGILTTTSDFAPGVLSEGSFVAMMPNRLELVNGDGLKQLFKDVLSKNPVKR